MGKDKALLPFAGGTLAAHVARIVAEAAGSAIVIGDPEKYRGLGYAVRPDRTPGAGPLGGIESALGYTAADWNLVVACDMPAVSAPFLRSLIETAERLNTDALVPCGPAGRPEPLSAVYHRRCHAALRAALDAGVRKVTDALNGLRVTAWTVDHTECFMNLNTPEEWLRHHDAH